MIKDEDSQAWREEKTREKSAGALQAGQAIMSQPHKPSVPACLVCLLYHFCSGSILDRFY